MCMTPRSECSSSVAVPNTLGRVESAREGRRLPEQRSPSEIEGLPPSSRAGMAVFFGVGRFLAFYRVILCLDNAYGKYSLS